MKRNQGIGDAVEDYLRRFYRDAGDIDAVRDVYASVIRETEKRLLSVTLDAVKGNKLKASRVLGINRNTFLRKVREFGLVETPLPVSKKRKRAS